MNSNHGIEILGVGFSAPDNIIKNDDFTSIIETSDEWIVSRTGISSRHISDGTPIYKFATKSAIMALKDANLTALDIDFVIATTVTNDFITPSLAALVAHDLGITDKPCVDLNGACAGFVYAVDMAHKYLADTQYKNILVVSAENLSRITNFADRSTCVLFGDGAGACIISKTENKYASILGSMPSGFDKIMAKNVKLENPFTNEASDEIETTYPHLVGNGLYMDGKEVYKFATSIMPFAVAEATKKSGFSLEELDLIIPHQANIRIVQTAAKNLNLPIDKFFINIAEFGNTSSASIPICLAEAKISGRLKKGDKVCLCGFGAGLVYAACTFVF